MNQSLIDRIHQCSTLPSLPSIAIEVLELAQKDKVDIAEIARIISNDPALSSKILRTVNSSFYGRGQAISTISHALVILGLQSVKTLVLGFSLVANLACSKSQGFKHLNYWRRSIYAATAARTISQKIHLVQQEECFLSTLLMDIGMLVLDQVLGDEYGAVYGSVTDHAKLAEAETRVLGMTHAEVGGLLASEWKLPPLLCDPIAHHHNPEQLDDLVTRKLAEISNLAGRCADIFVTENPAAAIIDVRRICLDSYGLDEAACDALLEEISKRTKEMAPLFEIRIAASISYEAILKKANEALVKLMLHSQRQVSTLEQQNTELKHAAVTDGLTGLANRACFDSFLAEHLAAAQEKNQYLSLLIMDLDRFKSVNDKHGHLAGDKVLKYVGKLLQSAARKQDLAARYGGEELALILPSTNRANAAMIAEAIRRAINAKPVNTGAASLSVSASIGVATFEPTGPVRKPAHLIKAADLAVYAAKHAGRNCVRIFSLPAQQSAAA
ncbi:MAG: GGDEF domain-containing protein [Phycisphaerales bacterium]|nr:GGDEF domain-containing protein [Phycisphaerales bacterium]